ncbi:MAG TPA: PhnD/SsuA/transferrin family substrate-binding protein [Methylotenera sp.]|nr:PhnD/SsuA/transferrin family substrate-binding protein [Methylotenera sp.]HPH04972.1 PhnD/SsuA/transferrin family substrate-binding protein [Methylotenera sp.]HPN00234.1 PhnD/SsuA/transferrin family substrate-binding protein [Methylotenera sp.]
MLNNRDNLTVIRMQSLGSAFQYCFALLLITLSFQSQAKPEYVVGVTEQGIRLATVEEVELGFNSELDKISKDKDYSLKIKVFPSDVELKKMISEHKAEGYFGSPVIFVEQMNTFGADHLYVPIINHQAKQRYVILVRNDSGVKQLAQLKQKRIAYCTTDEVGVLFLQQALKDKNLGLSDTFFSKIIIKKNPNLVASAVFFKETEAAVILENDFMVAAELNPQLQKQMHVIETSPEYVTHLLAFRDDGHTKSFNLDDTVKQLSLAIQRLSLMKSYKFGMMQKISVEDLKSVRALVESLNLNKAKQ